MFHVKHSLTHRRMFHVEHDVPVQAETGEMIMTELPQITTDMAGCWLDGAMGWHNAYRVVDRAEEYGFTVPPEYTDALRRYQESDYDGLTDDQYHGVHEAISGQGELSEMATDYLQERAPAGYVFVWDMGELSLLEDWQACEDGCTEDTRCKLHQEEDE